MGCEVSLAAGELAGARQYAERLAALPCYRDYAHPALARRFQVDLLSGDLTGAVRRGTASWPRGGGPVGTAPPPLAVDTYALAVVHGLLGNDSELEAWRAVTDHLRDDSMTRADGPGVGWAPTLDAWLSLHRNQPHEALEILAADLVDPQWRKRPTSAHVATLVRRSPAEAAALSGSPDLGSLVTKASVAARANPVAAALVRRAAALAGVTTTKWPPSQPPSATWARTTSEIAAESSPRSRSAGKQLLLPRQRTRTLPHMSRSVGIGGPKWILSALGLWKAQVVADVAGAVSPVLGGLIRELDRAAPTDLVEVCRTWVPRRGHAGRVAA